MAHMTGTANLLYMAYAHIEAGNLDYARSILDSLVSVNSLNAEVWEAYMQISESCEELDSICEQFLNVPDFNPTDRESILDYYYFLRQRMKYGTPEGEEREMVTFELVDQFTYNLKDRASLQLAEYADSSKGEQIVAGFLNKAIMLVCVFMLVIGLKLIAGGNTFGYWIIMVLGISVFIGLGNLLFPEAKPGQFSDLVSSEVVDEEPEDGICTQLKLDPSYPVSFRASEKRV